jgi:predicted secreted hydrolase
MSTWLLRKRRHPLARCLQEGKLLRFARRTHFTGIVLIGIWLLVPHAASSADTLPVPKHQATFSYFPVATPVAGTTASETKPIAIGPFAEGGRTLSVQISLPGFSGSVDVFFGLYAPAFGSDAFYLLDSAGNLQPLLGGLVIWKSGPAMIEEQLFGAVDTSLLPEGTYSFYLLVAPQGTTDQYYLWQTSVKIKRVIVYLPEDDGVHDTPVEWWYWTGHLEDTEGGRYGFEEVFFLVKWLGTNYIMAHQSITDITKDTFSYDVKIIPAYPEELADGLHLSAENLSGFLSSDGKEDILNGSTGGYEMALDLIPAKPPVLNLDGGFGELVPGLSTYYYSRTRLDARGTLQKEGEKKLVKGTAWFDHQWGDLFKVLDIGWDWFGIQLDDGVDIMLYVIRDQATGPVSGGTIVDSEGGYETLQAGQFQVTALTQWTSPGTGCTYPSGWVISFGDQQLVVLPEVQDQEIPSPFPYWEGASTVSGARTGRAYVELTGYCSNVVGAKWK